MSAVTAVDRGRLAHMTRRRPTSRADFAQVFGVGEAKLRDFADSFLAAISESDSVP